MPDATNRKLALSVCPVPVIIDTDPGVDDVLALAYALRSGFYDVQAVTVVAGNCDVDRGVENACRLLDLLFPPAGADALPGSDLSLPRTDSPLPSAGEGPGVRGTQGGGLGIRVTHEPGARPTPPPVYRGAARPLRRDYVTAEDAHGWDGLGGVTALADDGLPRYPPPRSACASGDAVDIILEALDRQPGRITLITLGPLTNVARAAQRAPRVLSRVHRIISMAGAFREPGNATPVAEYNVWADPDACQEVLGFVAGLEHTGGPGSLRPRLLFVGLDVTHQVRLLRGDLDRAAAADPGLGRFLIDCTAASMEFHTETRGFEGLYLHDPLAVMLAAHPYLCGVQRLAVEVECAGSVALGMTVADRRGPLIPAVGTPVDVCTTVQADQVIDLFLEGLFRSRRA